MYCDELARYDLGSDHPLKPVRLRMTYELLKAYRFFDRAGCPVVQPRLATRDEILLAHDADYVATVEAIGAGERPRQMYHHGFGFGDNPPFEGMYEASLLYTGATVTAAEKVLNGEADLAFSISGGLHHAMHDRASGFCVFNDPVIGIRRLLEKFGRVAYVDVDAHHGDGVQAAFYEDNRVLTVSVHESGETLFPGTGFPGECGKGAGRGYAVNLPLFARTGDDVYVEAFEAVVPAAIATFKPEVIVTQLGADAHFEDPLAHLNLTTAGWRRIIARIASFGTPMVALGGGGYNLSSVCRMWTIAASLLAGVELEADTPADFAERHHIKRLDDEEGPICSQRDLEITRSFAHRMTRDLLENVLPLIQDDK